MNNEKGIKVKCKKWVDGTKDRFNSIENDEIYYEEQELLPHVGPPYPTNSRMTVDFSDSAIKNIVAAIKKLRSSTHAWNWILGWTFVLVFPAIF